MRVLGNIRCDGGLCIHIDRPHQNLTDIQFNYVDSVEYCLEEGVGVCVVHESWCQDLALGSWMITFGS